MFYIAALISCKRTMTFTCKLIKTVLVVTTYKRGVAAENTILTNLKAVDC